jgi:hypothetical protein
VIDEVPSVQDLRWPILVVLDALGDDELLDLEERVAQHLELSDEARNAVDPESDRRFFLKRIEQALEDLYQADAIEPDDDGLSLHITDVGRRFTEPQAHDLPEVIPSCGRRIWRHHPTRTSPRWVVDRDAHGDVLALTAFSFAPATTPVPRAP